jgi:hypothetical protein
MSKNFEAWYMYYHALSKKCRILGDSGEYMLIFLPLNFL